MRVFVLEDSHSRNVLFTEIFAANHTTVMAKTVAEAKRKYPEYAPYDLILLDHDLEDEHYEDQRREVGTGTEFARWLAQQEHNKAPVIIHSYNPDGALRMQAALDDAGWIGGVMRMPFGLRLLQDLQLITERWAGHEEVGYGHGV